MKKILLLLLIFCCSLIACKEQEKEYFSFEESEISLYATSEYVIKYKTNIDNITFECSNDNITIMNNVIIANKQGNSIVTAYKGEEILATINVVIKEKEEITIPVLNILEDNIVLKVGEQKELQFETNRKEEVVIETSSELFTIDGKIITANKPGDGIIILSLYDIKKEIKVHIYKEYYLVVKDITEIEKEKEYQINDFFDTDYDGSFAIETSSNITYDGNRIIASETGDGYITISFEDQKYQETINLQIYQNFELGFVRDEIIIKVGDEEIVEVVTDYDGDYKLTIENEEIISIDDVFVLGLKPGTSLVTVSFEFEGRIYSKSMKVIVQKVLKTFTVIIDGKMHRMTEDSNIYDILFSIYGVNYYEEREGYIFKGWFYDIDLQEEVKQEDILTGNLTLYPKFIMNDNCFYINQIFNDREKTNASGDIITISPTYRYTDSLVLDNYKLFVIKYNIAEEEYVIVKTDTLEVPFDGFCLGIKKSSESFAILNEKLIEGKVLYLDTYSVNTSRNFSLDNLINYQPEKINPSVDCSYSSVYDVYAKTQLFVKDGDKKAYPASTTKIVTAIAALSYCPIDAKYTIGDEQDLMWEGSTPGTAGMKKGEVWTLEQILYAAMLPSGNDAAYAAAACTINYLYPNHNFTNREVINKFADLMNEVFEKVGATNSHFLSPDGNSYYTSTGQWEERLKNHYTSANDMIKVACYAFRIPVLAQIVSTPSISFKIENGGVYSFNNTNLLIRSSEYYYKGAIGLKTGTTTPGGYCLISGVERNRRFIISVVYKGVTSPGRYTDSLAIYKQIFK